MLLVADLIECLGPSARTLRLLWIGPGGEAYVIDVHDDNALPELTTLGALVNDINGERARLKRDDPFQIISADANFSEARRQVRDDAWTAIEPLLLHQPGIFQRRRRAGLVADQEKAGVATRVTLYEYLRRFWQRGMTKNSLLADYPHCGGPGKTRNSKTGKKLGRPRKYGDLPGVNVCDETRRVFQIGVDRYYAASKRFTKQGAYDKLIKEFYSIKQFDPETGLIVHVPTPTGARLGVPSYDQFLYWVEHDNLAPVLRRLRLGDKRYDKDCRGLLGTASSGTWGPGSRFQIDATVADVYLVSRFDRKRIIGRPVLYVVIDVFSRMIVGIYIGLEGPSWAGAMMALSNTSEDKVDFCQRYGRTITADMWPCRHLPAAIMGDGGEIAGDLINMLANNLNVKVETTASYRADWKGVVERRFRLLPAVFAPYVPGYIEVDYRERGGTDYRYDATLDIDDFTRIIIECVLYFNNQHELSKYDNDRDVASDLVPPIPVELWEWGVANRSGALRAFKHEHVQFLLMPTAMGTVTEHGIQFKGSYYTSPQAMEELWFDRARQDGRWRVPLSFDSRDMDRVCLHDARAPMGFQSAMLTERSRANRGLSLAEIEQQSALAKHGSANRKLDGQMAKADLIGNIQAIVDDAKQKQLASRDSSPTRVTDIRDHRAEEKQRNRSTEAFRPGLEKKPPARSADVVPFPGSPEASFQDYSEPGIAELFGDED